MKYFIYLIVFISIIIGIYLLHIDINMEIASYIISTTLDKLIVLITIIWVPIHIIRKIIISLTYKLKHDIYINNIINFISTISEEKDKNTLIEILKYSNNNQFIKQIKDINNFLSLKKHDKAIILIDKIKVKKYNETLLLKYRCQIYKEKNDLANFIIYAKKGILLKGDSLWFLSEMFDLIYKNKSLDSEIVYLYNSLKLTKNNNKIQYKKYFCLIIYFYVQYLSKQNTEKAKSIVKKAIKEYQDFVPFYEFLIKIYIDQNRNNRIKDLLKDLWKTNKSYEVIKLWQKYYNETSDNKIIDDINSVSNNIEQNNLLLASIYGSNDRFLESQNILQNISSSITKNLVMLDIMQKENNFRNANKIIEEFLQTFSKTNFWNNYIN